MRPERVHGLLCSRHSAPGTRAWPAMNFLWRLRNCYEVHIAEELSYKGWLGSVPGDFLWPELQIVLSVVISEEWFWESVEGITDNFFFSFVAEKGGWGKRSCSRNCAFSLIGTFPGSVLFG